MNFAGMDMNRLLLVLGLIAIVAIAAFTNNRLEIGATGLRLEKNADDPGRHGVPPG